MSYLAFWLLSFWSPAAALQPRPGLAPADVVNIVRSALQNCNSPIPNAGVYTAYRFASPANRAVTGPYGHFLGLVKAADFAPLLHSSRSDAGPIAVTGGHAEQLVTVHLDRDRDTAFKFTLSLQTEGRYRGCWMVDAVSREP